MLLQDIASLVYPYLPHIIVAVFIFKFVFSGPKTETGTKRAACQSADCVRCALYGEVLSQAEQRLLSYFSANKNVACSFLKEEYLSYVRHIQESKDSDLIVRLEESKQKPSIFDVSKLTSQPWWIPDESNDCVLLNDTSRDTTEEISTVLGQWFQDPQSFRGIVKKNDTPSGKWYTFSLVNQGQEVDDNTARFPITWNAIRMLPNVMKNNVFGNAFISVLMNGSEIEAHYGPTNVRLRCHLGILSPKKAKIRVGGRLRSWDDNKTLLFDDSFLHSVSYPTCMQDKEQYRAVLIVDLWHPELSSDERRLIDHMFSS